MYLPQITTLKKTICSFGRKNLEAPSLPPCWKEKKQAFDLLAKMIGNHEGVLVHLKLIGSKVCATKVFKGFLWKKCESRRKMSSTGGGFKALYNYIGCVFARALFEFCDTLLSNDQFFE